MNNITQMIIMISIFFSITAGVHYYLWVRLVQNTHLYAPWNYVATGALITLAVSIPTTMFLGRSLDFETARIVTWVPYLWMAVMMLLFVTLVSIDLVKAIVFASKKLTSPNSIEADPSRRVALAQMAAGSTILLVSTMAGAGVVRASRKPSIKRVVSKLQHFPPELNGLKMAQISDLHIGITAGSEWLTALVTRINNMNPDVVVITGDLVDGDAKRLWQQLAPLEKLKTTHGVFFVTGNHEYYTGTVQLWIEHIEKLGITVLRNQSVSISNGDASFVLAGVDDYKSANMAPGHGQSIPAAMKNVDPNKAVVLLAHQPKAVFEAAEYNVDLVLSGHTHGGQIWPFNYFVGLQQPYNKGLYQHNDRTQIYVNQGTFLWGPPMRLGTECEITEHILQAKS